jgi:hypothetical protein
MSFQDDQDLADKALAQEFASYLASVAKEFVKPVEVAADDAQKKVRAAISSAEAGFQKADQSAQQSIEGSAQRAITSLNTELSRVDKSIKDATEGSSQSISDAAHDAKTVITTELKNASSSVSNSVGAHTETFTRASDELRSQLSGLGNDLTSIVASVSQGHETTRKKLIDLLEDHRSRAEQEARDQVHSTNAALRKDLSERLTDLMEPLETAFKNSAAHTFDIVRASEATLAKDFLGGLNQHAAAINSASEITAGRTVTAITNALDEKLRAARMVIVNDVDKRVAELANEIRSGMREADQSAKQRQRQLLKALSGIAILVVASIVTGVMLLVR